MIFHALAAQYRSIIKVYHLRPLKPLLRDRKRNMGDHASFFSILKLNVNFIQKFFHFPQKLLI